MRLIDADELIKRMRKWMPKDPCGKEQTIEEVVATDIAVSVCMEIEETPTAFDKEKVIEKIKEIMNDESIRFVDQAVNRTIEIVEKGGIE